MRRFAPVLFLCCLSAGGWAQNEIKVFGEQSGNAIIIFASNSAPCPTSVKVELELTNLEPTAPLPDYVVVPGDSQRFQVTQLRVLDPRSRFSYKSRFTYVLGDVGLERYEDGHVYDLPFAKGGRFQVFQGYNGNSSHQNQFALDFAMPEGTPVLAAREGVVVRIQEANDQSCPQAECARFNNYVMVYHRDGTFAEYTHLRKDGATVNVGDRIKAGDTIGYSGSTGWATGPHLHFVCFLARMGTRTTFPTRFRTGDGSETEQIEEKKWYARKY